MTVSENVDESNSKMVQSQQTLPIFEKLEKLSHTVTNLKKDHKVFWNEVKSINANFFAGSELFTALQSLGEEHDTLKKKYHLECSERRRWYNEVIELKGNIRVFCRCRPLNDDEIVNGYNSVANFESVQDNELKITGTVSSKKQFKFDHLFTPEDNQEAVFAKTSPLVVSVLDGFNVCIFAYGQTGTGKTFTMEGTPEDRGVNYRTLEELFRLSEERSDIMRYKLFVSMLEVYNEKIKDLLVGDGDQPAKKLEVKQSAEGTQEVPGLSEVPVFKTEEVWKLLKSGSCARSVGSTNANKLSSRSHCLLRVTVRGENLVNRNRTRSHLWLVDLAGSERVGKIEVEGERLKESQFINKSLSALGDVISALASKTSHIPYRNSKLTHILQSSLGGDCKTLMFVQICPSSSDLGETICSLNFASRVRGVEHGPARKQTDVSELFKYKQLAEKAKVDEKETKKLQDSLESTQLRLSAREHTCRTLQEKVRDLESQLAEERNTKQKQETKGALDMASSQSTNSTYRTAFSTFSEKRPPYGPSKLRVPLISISNLMPSHPFPSTSLKGKNLPQARRGYYLVKPTPPVTSQVLKPKGGASIAKFQSGSSSSMMNTSMVRSNAAFRVRDRVGMQSSSVKVQTSCRPSKQVSSSQSMTNEAITVAAPRSSKFMGSASSRVIGSSKPEHPTVVALPRKPSCGARKSLVP